MKILEPAPSWVAMRDACPRRATPRCVPALPRETDVLTGALAYAHADWYVGPLRSPSKNPGSILGSGWQNLTSRDPGTIISWFAGTGYGVFLHVGRSGAIVFDGDHLATLHPAIARAIAELNPPEQSTRPGRSHFVFAQPDGREFGNSLGSLGGGWGDVRGANGVIVVFPSIHSDGGRYRWVRTGIVPVLPDYVADRLPDAQATSPAAAGDEVADFLDQHTTQVDIKPLTVLVASYRRKIAVGESRHATLTGYLAGAMKEARAGLYPARLAADTFQAIFVAAVANAPISDRQGASRTGVEASREWDGLLRWAVGQANAADLGAVLHRIATKVQPAVIAIESPDSTCTAFATSGSTRRCAPRRGDRP